MSNIHFVMTIYSHHFSLTRLSPVGRNIATRFAGRYVQFGLVPGGGQMHRKALKVFAAANAERTEFRFHINQLSDFYKLLLQMGYDNPALYQTVKTAVKDTPSMEFSVNEKFQPFDYQVPIIDYLSKVKPVCKLVGLRTGGGKALKNSELIKIPGGWKKMGDIKVGDIVTAKDGTPTNVTAVYPQGKVQLYKVEFADGRFVECCAEHLWNIFYIKTVEHRRWRTVNTLEMIRLLSQPQPRVYIDLIDPEDSEDMELPIHPYLLGVLLGDGCMRNGTVTITTPDDFIINECSKYLDESQEFRKLNNKDTGRCPEYRIANKGGNGRPNSFITILRQMGLMEKMSYEKSIPEYYLRASKKQRLELLQGLLDTDGTVCKNGSPSFSSTSHSLAKSVQYLIRSLGGIGYMSDRITSYTHNGEKRKGRVSYKVGIRHKKPSELMRLPRKKKRLNDDNQYAQILKLRVKSIAKVGMDEAQCISVDHPDKLYVATDFIATHNTFCASSSIANLKKIPCIIVKPAYIEKWTEDLIKIFDLSIDDIMVVQGGKHLIALLNMVKEKGVNYKAVIVSNRTMQLWLSAYEKGADYAEDLGYCIPPYRFFEHIGAGVRLIDEVHQDFHFNFKLDLYTNVEYAISLSATLITNDPFLRTMHDVAYPPIDRCASPDLGNYISSYAVHYRFDKPDKIRTSEYGSNNYSHGALEKSVTKHAPTLHAYINLIDYVVSIGYFNSKKKDKKCIIFAYSIDMCTAITKHFEGKYPDFDVRRYVAEDPYENLMQADIIVSTLGSAGTAVDIPNLTNVILTTAVDSIQSNVQSLGRLRKLDNGQTPTEFHYFVCEDIPKHLEYHERKKQMLSQRAKTFIDVYSGHVV